MIQPHLPVRLPCYDFTPIADPTFDSSLLAVGPLASGVTNFRGVTGGVYKARERIHPDVADSGLLATPTSRSRVADFDPRMSEWGNPAPVMGCYPGLNKLGPGEGTAGIETSEYREERKATATP